MKKVRIGVVPEHFSMPLFAGVQHGIFSKHGIDLEIIEHPRGTGSMCRSLRQNELEVAIALTEGLISDIVQNGPDFKLVSEYIHSPLEWAIVSTEKPENPLKKPEDLSGKTFGISRIGSGSHHMANILSEDMKFAAPPVFKTIGGLSDLLEATDSGEIDSFLWERFMLKPYTDKGQLRYLGSIFTPWPCFLIAVKDSLIKEHPNFTINLLEAVAESVKYFVDHPAESIQSVIKKCHLKEEDAKNWFQRVQFYESKSPDSVHNRVARNVLEMTYKKLGFQKPYSDETDDLLAWKKD